MSIKKIMKRMISSTGNDLSYLAIKIQNSF